MDRYFPNLADVDPKVADALRMLYDTTYYLLGKNNVDPEILKSLKVRGSVSVDEKKEYASNELIPKGYLDKNRVVSNFAMTSGDVGRRPSVPTLANNLHWINGSIPAIQFWDKESASWQSIGNIATATEAGMMSTSDWTSINSMGAWSINRYGFPDISETTISFDGTTFTLTGAGWRYVREGILYTITGNKTVEVPSTKGSYNICIDSITGDLNCYAAPLLFDDKVPISTILVDVSTTPAYWVSDDRHSCFVDRAWHRTHHYSDGTEYVSGGLVADCVVSGIANTQKCFSVSEAVITDEELFHTLPALPLPNGLVTNYVIYYRTGASTWTWELSDMPFRYTPSGFIQYDDGATWMKEGTDGKYYNTYLLYTNLNGYGRYVIVHGRGEFDSEIQAGMEDYRRFVFDGFGIDEYVMAYQFTWKT